ncbi:enoyl CoA hydratase domain-containing protein 1 [Phlyctochytrium planicorne]|nr:enoyl CoA hydratase domain-containing protein 1 [Phlyctochytrium planicorne]
MASPSTLSAAARSIRTKFAKLGSGTVTLSLPHSVHHIPSTSIHKPSTAKSVTDQHQNIAVITLRNAARKNALSPAMMSQFADAVDLLESVDLGVAAESFLTSESGAEMSTLMHDTLSRLRRLPLITVAAVQGFALGGGAELTLGCDLRVIDESATLRFVQVRMGVIPGWQGGTRLAHLVGRSKALKLLAGAKPLTGKDCYEIGLADEVVAAPQEAPEAALAMLDSWTSPTLPTGGTDESEHLAGARGDAGYPIAIRGVKKLISKFDMEDGGFADDQLAFERKIFGTLWGGRANLDAIAKNIRKRAATSPPAPN